MTDSLTFNHVSNDIVADISVCGINCQISRSWLTSDLSSKMHNKITRHIIFCATHQNFTDPNYSSRNVSQMASTEQGTVKEIENQLLHLIANSTLFIIACYARQCVHPPSRQKRESDDFVTEHNAHGLKAR